MNEQKVVLITGCSSGIGLITSIYLSQKGYKVYATMRDLDKKDNLLSEAKKGRTTVEILQLDVTDEKSIKAAVGIILEKEGRIDVLVNNAGYGAGGFLEDFTMDEIKAQFETNFFGLIRVTQAVLPAMRKQKSGHIVNISSIGGKMAFPVLSAYNASKFAVEALTESLRAELAPFGIKVCAVEPLSISTRFNDSVRAAKKSESFASPYHEYFKRFKKNMAKMMSRGEDPVIIAQTIYHAITSQNPKRCYPAGKGARTFLMVKSTLPDRFVERIINKTFLG